MTKTTPKDTATIDLFHIEEIMPSIEERIDEATKAITALFEEGRPVVQAFSGGKDSACAAALMLNAAAAYASKGGKPFVIFTTGDTRVENPEIVEHYQDELRKVQEFCERHGIRCNVGIVKPSLASTFQVSILSGRALPSWAGVRESCASDWKVTPQRSYRRRLFRELAHENMPEAVTLLGSRFGESQRRSMNMSARGDRWDVPVRNKDGELVLCPISRWSTEDVWEFIGMVTSGILDAYSDFSELLRIYSHSAGTSCAVVAEAIHDGAKSKKGGCGARHGCFTCLQSEDRSLQTMLEFDPRYEYARGLNKLNKFLRAIRNDWSRRHWVGRTIKEGFIALQPDTLHPGTILELTRYMLQLDFDEEVRARQAGESPKFRVLPEDIMVALDAMQSLNGVCKPFQIWADYRDIRERGVRYDIPEIATAPVSEVPAARFLFVGEAWDDDANHLGSTGLRDAYVEALCEGSGCERDLKVLRSGDAAWDLETGQSMTVDDESLFFLMEFELDRMLQKFDRDYFPGGVTEAYKWYVSFGVLTLSHSQQSEHDEICRRTAFKDRLGLTMNYDIDQLMAKSIAFADLPPAARKAWGSKATTDTSQTDFLAVLDDAMSELLEAA